MTRLPDDHLDPYEAQLARRVSTFADQAVRPIDAAAIAAAAHTGAHRRTLAGRIFGSSASMARLGVVLAGALVTAAAFGVFINAGGPNQASDDPVATPTGVPGAAEQCNATDLVGEITAWEGAAGHRIATIGIHNGATSSCSVPAALRPALVDSDGHALIVGAPVSDSPTFTFEAGGNVRTLVDMANYCGQAPSGQLRIRLYLPDQASIEAAPAANLPNAVDPPPCNGPNAAAEIQMQPLSLAAPAT
jgi:hypothetical protein